jgi:F-type H+-transporting ATPase subunit b
MTVGGAETNTTNIRRFGPIQIILAALMLDLSVCRSATCGSRIAEGEDVRNAVLKRIEKQKLAASSERIEKHHRPAAIAKANDEAVRLINEAKEGAAAFSEQKAQEAIAQAQHILAKAEAAAQGRPRPIAAELKREFGRLVAATTAQVTGKVLTADDQKRINEDALAKVEG